MTSYFQSQDNRLWFIFGSLTRDTYNELIAAVNARKPRTSKHHTEDSDTSFWEAITLRVTDMKW